MYFTLGRFSVDTKDNTSVPSNEDKPRNKNLLTGTKPPSHLFVHIQTSVLVPSTNDSNWHPIKTSNCTGLRWLTVHPGGMWRMESKVVDHSDVVLKVRDLSCCTDETKPWLTRCLVLYGHPRIGTISYCIY